MSDLLILNSFFTKRPAMTARGRYKPHRQYAPSVRSRWPLCLNENLGGSFLYKESGEGKEGGVKYKRCGVIPGRTELNPRLLPTHLPSQLLFVGNSETPANASPFPQVIVEQGEM
jgi:hypothetical protein